MTDDDARDDLPEPAGSSPVDVAAPVGVAPAVVDVAPPLDVAAPADVAAPEEGVAPLRRRRFSFASNSSEPVADWRWVDEWRRGDEATPWGPGIALAAFAALIIGSAVYVISEGLADQVVLAILANVVVAAGLSPALWMSRQLPVLRWISLGGAVGTVVAWISLLFFPNF